MELDLIYMRSADMLVLGVEEVLVNCLKIGSGFGCDVGGKFEIVNGG